MFLGNSRSLPSSKGIKSPRTLTSIIISIMAPFSFASAINLKITYDSKYDYRETKLSTVTCDSALSRLLGNSEGFFGSLNSWPNIGRSQAINGPTSPNCGSCWKLTYDGEPLPLYVTAIESASESDGFVISIEAMDTLTNGHAVQLGTINASTITEVSRALCGLPA